MTALGVRLLRRSLRAARPRSVSSRSTEILIEIALSSSQLHAALRRGARGLVRPRLRRTPFPEADDSPASDRAWIAQFGLSARATSAASWLLGAGIGVVSLARGPRGARPRRLAGLPRRPARALCPQSPRTAVVWIAALPLCRYGSPSASRRASSRSSSSAASCSPVGDRALDRPPSSWRTPELRAADHAGRHHPALVHLRRPRQWRQSIWAAIAAHTVFDGVQLLFVIPQAARSSGSVWRGRRASDRLVGGNAVC